MYFEIRGRDPETSGGYDVQDVPTGKQYYLTVCGTDHVDVGIAGGKVIQNACEGKSVYFREYPVLESERDYDTGKTWYKSVSRFTVLPREELTLGATPEVSV